MKLLFWKVAKSTIEGEFLMQMERIREESQAAYDYLMERDPRTWCRAFFRIGVACESIENGMTECFNVIIVDARKKPLLTMLEDIRLYMMERFYNLRMAADKWEDVVCPGAIKKMEVFAKDIR